MLITEKNISFYLLKSLSFVLENVWHNPVLDSRNWTIICVQDSGDSDGQAHLALTLTHSQLEGLRYGQQLCFRSHNSKYDVHSLVLARCVTRLETLWWKAVPHIGHCTQLSGNVQVSSQLLFLFSFRFSTDGLPDWHCDSDNGEDLLTLNCTRQYRIIGCNRCSCWITGTSITYLIKNLFRYFDYTRITCQYYFF